MKQHTGMEAHDGYVPHSHEVRADHRGVQGRSEGSVIRLDGEELITKCGHSFVTCHTDRCFRVGDVYTGDRARFDGEVKTGRDKNDIPMPDGWAVYFDGELVFSADDEKWREIGPAIEKIMEG